MSRKAKLPIALPSGVEIKVDGLMVHVKGPKGSLTQEIKPGIQISAADGLISVTMDSAAGQEYAYLGLYWSLLSNMVKGVSEGFEKKLEMIGVGFRAAVQGDKVDLQVGLSHPCKITIPEGIEVSVEKNTLITVKGRDKQKVGQFAADLRAKRPPEPYKGKGIRYSGEYVRRKAGKAGKK